MSTTMGNPTSAVRAQVSRPQRLHHAAWVTRDQEATRHFYEDILGLPLVATWAERAPSTGREYCHTFFALGAGGGADQRRPTGTCARSAAALASWRPHTEQRFPASLVLRTASAAHGNYPASLAG